MTAVPPRSVLVVSHVSVVWGAQRRLIDLAPRLLDLGYRLTLAGPPGELAEAWRALGLPVEPLELPRHRGVRADDGGRPGPGSLVLEGAVEAWSAGVIARRARRHELVQSHSLYAHLETAVAARLARRPMVIDAHDIVNPGVGRRLLQAAARLATVTVANSRATAEMVGGAGRGDVVIVHPGVDLDVFRPAPPDPDLRRSLTAHPDEPLVGILGRVDPRKGVDTLVDAMAKLQSSGRGACLAIVGRELVGSPEWQQGLRARATELLGDRVRFIGPTDEPHRVLSALDALVNASHHEPFGRTILEAQASGVPVVATDAGGVPEFVADGRTGLLVPPQDADAIAAALGRLFDDPELRRRIADGGRAQATAEFGLDRQAEKVAAAYGRALGGST
jgi:glycosyltransferase involved in cell wall biosynthesis